MGSKSPLCFPIDSRAGSQTTNLTQKGGEGGPEQIGTLRASDPAPSQNKTTKAAFNLLASKQHARQTPCHATQGQNPGRHQANHFAAARTPGTRYPWTSRPSDTDTTCPNTSCAHFQNLGQTPNLTRRSGSLMFKSGTHKDANHLEPFQSRNTLSHFDRSPAGCQKHHCQVEVALSPQQLFPLELVAFQIVKQHVA